ncbi:MAG: ATP-binding cassette domain-containing protein [Bacteroidia bacterium]|nr:ATP-binding cassette domain-containing protein [Bacteroidia bacterium]MDW8347309.1 ATP-binding cassette domain-containing protein [Bacteroidia bacterium]
MNILSLQNITKRYQEFIAVNNISLNIPKGSIYGMLGPNGAGKTSTLRMITQITLPDSGQILFEEEPLSQKHLNRIGYMPEERGLYPKMKVYEQLLYFVKLRGYSKSQAQQLLSIWIDKLNIKEWLNKKSNELSKGQQQKLQFIATVAHQPSLLILDEPFSGLDPVNANLIKDEISELHKKGTTIIFSTHRMEQVEEICDNICLIHQGKVVLDGTLKGIKQKFRKPLYQIRLENEDNTLFNLERVEVIERLPNHILIKCIDFNQDRQVLEYLTAHLPITYFAPFETPLSNIFIEVVS